MPLAGESGPGLLSPHVSEAVEAEHVVLVPWVAGVDAAHRVLEDAEAPKIVAGVTRHLVACMESSDNMSSALNSTTAAGTAASASVAVVASPILPCCSLFSLLLCLVHSALE